MKLHQAIEDVLENKQIPLTFDEIANEINLNELYLREDFKNLLALKLD